MTAKKACGSAVLAQLRANSSDVEVRAALRMAVALASDEGLSLMRALVLSAPNRFTAGDASPRSPDRG